MPMVLSLKALYLSLVSGMRRRRMRWYVIRGDFTRAIFLDNLYLDDLANNYLLHTCIANRGKSYAGERNHGFNDDPRY